MSKINFRIVEVSESDRSYDDLYDDFKEDFLNKEYSVSDLRNKYSIPNYVYREWSSKIREEYGLNKKPTLHHSPILKPDIHLYKLSDGWGIRKRVNDDMKYFGRYSDKDTARFVRDKLVKCDWDKSVADELIKEYGIVVNSKIDPDELMLKYGEFKHLYLDVPTKYEDIMSILDISPYKYNWLLHRLREEIPDVKKNTLRCYGSKLTYKKHKKHKKPTPIKVKERPMRYIHKQKNGKYSVVKIIDGKAKSFGTYRLLESAKNRRSKLEANGWIA